MWLPKPVYGALPVTYALMGVLFIMGAVYMDLKDPMGPMYLALGILSIAAAITVSYWRAKHPGGRQKVEADESQSDQSQSADS